jgi:hypothetical protein
VKLLIVLFRLQELCYKKSRWNYVTKNQGGIQAWWCKPVIPVFGRQRGLKIDISVPFGLCNITLSQKQTNNKKK